MSCSSSMRSELDQLFQQIFTERDETGHAAVLFVKNDGKIDAALAAALPIGRSRFCSQARRPRDEPARRSVSLDAIRASVIWANKSLA